MKLLLLRHGNTFAATDRVVWVGARTNLPLVQSGREQAAQVGASLARSATAIDMIVCGPLLRTRQTAEIVAEHTGVAPGSIETADELREIDYGLWEGKSNEEIRRAYGDTAIDGWQKSSEWPSGFGWQPPLDVVAQGWAQCMAQIAARSPRTCLVVSSNGVFRVVARSLGIVAADAKMRTGALSLLDVSVPSTRVVFWDKRPDELPNDAF